MKPLLLLLFFYPALAWAQADTLKPITSELIPTYGGQYGPDVAKQYMYDGLDISRKQVGQYIMASGDREAMETYQRYLSRRRTGNWIEAGGLLSMSIGGILVLSNKPNSDGNFTYKLPTRCPPNTFCNNLGTIDVTDVKRERVFKTGTIMAIIGLFTSVTGHIISSQESTLRTAVQQYNRALKQRGISWQMTPYSTPTHTGAGLIGTF